nr:myosin-4 isoform X1 [Leptinotarsa decemlineata]
MSDTDDTEDLLLIPPDFFVVESDSSLVGPYYNIVNSLIKQVDNLKNRITSIECNESFLSSSLDYYIESPHKMQNSVKGFRKYNSTDDICLPSSAQSTPQKPLTKFKLNSLPASPNLDRFNIGRTSGLDKEPITTKLNDLAKVGSTLPTNPVKEDDLMLGEIDVFLSKVKTIQRLNTARNLENEFNRYNLTSQKNNDIDASQKNVDQQQQKCDMQSTAIKERSPVKKNTFQSGDKSESVPDLKNDVGDIIYNDRISAVYQSNYEKHTNRPEITEEKYLLNSNNHMNFTNDSSSSFDRYPLSDSSTDSTLVTRYERHTRNRSDLVTSPLHSNALSILNVHKQLLETNGIKKHGDKAKDPKPRSSNTMGTSIGKNLGLLSLADIWSNNSEIQLNQSQLSQKLQEEKLRRQHCEDMIQKLQNRNLELQEKLSVAIKVDDSKNKAIHQFQDALEKILMKLERIDKEKREYENEISKLKKKHLNEMENATQKLIYYEQEVSKAVSLAHSNEEKMSIMENRCFDLQNEIQSVEVKYKDLQEHYEREIERNKQLSELLNSKEMEFIENKSVLNDAKSEMAKSRKTIEVCQTDLNKMKDENSHLQNDLKYEKEQNVKLNGEKKKLMSELDGFQTRENELKAELSRVKKEMENNKMELRHFYQGQVEILVQNKLKEFQSQLDQAQASFKEDIKKRELSIAKTAATHIQQISEKNSLEIKLLEKKHHEEIKLLQFQIVQHKQQADILQNKFEQLQEKRLQIAKQLQKVMESQWTETFRIIASGKSPTLNDETTFSTVDQLNSLKTRSYSNVEEVLAQQHEEQFNIIKRRDRRENSVFGNGYNEKVLQDAVVCMDETPVSSRTKDMEAPVVSSKIKGNQFSENDIQKYIHLLLNRKPSNPTQDESVEEQGKVKCDNEDHTSWLHEKEVINRSNLKGHQKEEKYPKPPWK